MPGCDQDLAGDGGLGRVALTTAALLDVEVELMPRVARAPGLLGGLDRGPPQHRRAGLGELPRCAPSARDTVGAAREAGRAEREVGVSVAGAYADRVVAVGCIRAAGASAVTPAPSV